MITNSNLQSEAIDNIIKYYQDILKYMPGNVYWFDRDLKSVGCNQNVLDMMHLSSVEEFQGKTFDELGKIGNWSAESTHAFKRDTLAVIKTGIAKLNVEEPPISHYDGRIISFLTSRVPVFNTLGDVICVVGISIDITERKKMEQAVIKMQRLQSAINARDELISICGHEFKTPLTALLLQTQEAYLKLEKNNIALCDPLVLKKFLLNYEGQINRLVRLVDDMLDTTRVNNMHFKLAREKVNFTQLITDLVQRFKAEYAVENCQLYCKHSEDIILECDAFRMEQAVINLLTNAYRYGQLKPIHIMLDQNEEHVILTVKDHGIGILKEDQERIFNRFERAISYSEISGLGLGLYIVKKIILAHKGNVTVESEVGEGASFMIELPR